MNIEEAIEEFSFFNEGDYITRNMEVAKDIVLTAYEKEKEKNKELSNSYDKLAKECNEENRRCMLLAVENQDLKEKNKEYENMIINHKKQLKQSGIYGYDYDLKILKEE